MASDGSVTLWLGLLKVGDRAAVRPLWERYFRALVSRAHSVLGSAPRGVADEEDVVLSAFASFCRGAEKGRFPYLDDRNDLWRVLLMLTAQKAAHLLRDQSRARRGGGKVRAEADLSDTEDGEGMLARVMGAEPTPDLAVQVAEEFQRLMDKLDSDELRLIALRKMEGYSAEEIAEQLGCVTRTVERKLRLIRSLWSEETPQ